MPTPAGVLLAAAALAAAAAAGAHDDACLAGDAACRGERAAEEAVEEREAAVLLQERRVRSRGTSSGRGVASAARAARAASAAAFKGGGWLAFSMHAGLVSGLLAAFPGGAPGQLEELFKEYGLLSSNSGGSWYAASLAYSESFVELTGKMAEKPEEAEAIFKDTWIAGLLEVKNMTEMTDDPACNATKLIQHYLDKANSRRGLSDRQTQNLQALLPAIAEGKLTWDIFVTNMLEKASQVPDGATLGSKVQPWAQDKDWLACVSVPAPNYKGKALTEKFNNVWSFSPENDTGNEIYMGMRSDSVKKWPFYLPAKFSVSLQGSGGSPPHPFCADSGCFGLRAVYRQGEADRWGKLTGREAHRESQTIGELAQGAFNSELPLGSVVSSSSAFAGAVALFQDLASKLAKDCVDLSTWVSSSPGGHSYETANDIRGKAFATDGENFDDFADKTVLTVVDGAYTENTGVAWAVAAGASQVVAFAGPDGLEPMFAGGSEQFGVCPGCALYFQIFETSTTDAAAQFEAFDSLALPSDSFQFLTGIKVGTIQTKTLDNEWFGIKAGSDVTLHVLDVESEKLSIGGSFTFNSFDDYATLVGEIMTTMTAPGNVEKVQEVLAEWFQVQ